MSTPNDDLSKNFLQDLFGSAYDALIVGTSSLDDAAIESGNLIAEMMGIVNSFALMATAFVIIYTISIGLMETAHAGETLGKRYSTLWTPIRGAIGVMFVAPFPGLGGFSVLQALILAAVGLSVGAGNMLWQKELQYFGQHGTVYPIINGGMPDTQLINKTLESLVCHEHQKAEFAKRENAVAEANIFLKGWTWLNNTAFATEPTEFRLPHSNPNTSGLGVPRHHDYGYIWPGACGEVVVKCDPPDPQGVNGGGGKLEAESTRAICVAKGEATVAMIDALRPIAQRIYSSDADPDNGNLSPPSAASAATLQAELTSAVKAYTDTYWSHYNTAKNAMQTERDSAMRNFMDIGGIGGWISAGSWHWVMAKVSLATNQASFIKPTYVDVDTNDIFNYEEEYVPLAARVKKFTDIMPRPNIEASSGDTSPSVTMVGGGANTDGGDLEAQMQKILGSELDALNSLVLEPGGDPIGTLSSFGGTLINSSVGIVTVYAGAKAVAASIQAGAGNVPVLGAIGAGASAAIWDLLSTLGAFLMFLVLPMMIAGGFLAYYLPAVPFIFWMFGVLGWMIMIVESLIAAPVWASSHVIPEGEGFAGNAARQGWMLLLNILFRPILLVLGLFFSMLMMYFIAQLALSGYTIYHSTVALSVGTMGGMFASVFGNIILVGLVIALSHKSHEMIYETADNVMRWVGANTKPLGEVGGEAAVSRTYMGAAGYVGQGANAVMAKGDGGGSPTPPKGSGEDDPATKDKGADTTPAGGSEAGGRSGGDANGASESGGREKGDMS